MNWIFMLRIFRASVIATVVLIALFAARQASAQGWIAGGGAGVTKQYDYEVGGPIANSEDGALGFRVFSGYYFVPVLAVAVSYVDLGTAKYDGPAFGGFTDELSAKGVDFSIISRWAPGTQKAYSLFSTIGLFRWTQDVHYVDPSGVFDYNDSGTSFSYGGGVEFGLGEGGQYGVHLDYQMFTKVGDPDKSGHVYDRSYISVGYDYRFGR